MTVQTRGCAACGRTIYALGAARIIEAAWTPEGDLVQRYLSGKLWRFRRKKVLVREADVVAVFDEYAGTGTLRIPRELNDLDLAIGLREIKVGSARFPFYELTDSVHAVTVTRLTHGFTKGTEETPRGEIDKAKWTIEQDRRHT